MIAVDPASEYEYILKDERKKPEEERSVFLLRSPTVSEMAKLEDAALSTNAQAEFSVKSGSQKLSALRIGLCGWRNVLDKDGNAIDFKGTATKVGGHSIMRPDDATLGLIPSKYRAELAEQITNSGSLSDDEAGN